MQKRYLMVLLMLVAITAGCSKMLDIHPKDQLIDEEVYGSLKTFEAAVLGCYADLNIEYSVLIGSVMADECKIGSQNSGVNGYAANLFRWTYSSDDDILYQTWKNYYQSVYRVNVLLENIENVPVEDGELPARLHLKGELQALRAFIHTELHRIFGRYNETDGSFTVPYVTVSNINQKNVKTPASDFYEQVWVDINAAAANMQDQSTVDFRFGKSALNALAARIALYQQHYKEAIAYANLVLAERSLSSEKQYSLIWKDGVTTEVLLRLKRNNANPIRPNTLWRNYGSGKTMFLPSDRLLNSFEDEEDVRRELFAANVNAGEDNAAPVAKYAGNDFSDRVNDIKVFRVAELLLIRAEAYWQNKDEKKALADINLLRKTRWQNAPDLRNLNKDEISRQRFLELAFEGHRYFDLKRWGAPIVRNKEDLSSETDDLTLAPDQPTYWLPIPHREVMMNPDIK